MPVERIIAVDFGTSTSVIRVKRYQDGQPVGDRLETKPVTFNMGSTVVPTLIQRRDTQESIYFGYDAEIPHRNTEICRNFKIEIENPDPAVWERARGLTAEFFSFLYKTYREQSLGGHLGESSDQERTIISYPVKWSEETKAFMLETARNAGFPNVEGQDEAQAAIQAVTVQSEKQLRDRGYFTSGTPITILLIDMGAGTTDLVLCRHTPGDTPQTEILSTWPHGTSALFGGHEVDELLRNYIKGLLPEEDADKALKKLGADKFKAWKEHEVSPALARGETVDFFSALDDRLEDLEIDVDYSIDRQTFEDFAQGYLRGLPELINGCLQKAEVDGDDVNLVIVTGGHSQWYFVREMLSGRLKRFGDVGLQKIQVDPGRIISVALPQETVALGLAYAPLRVAMPKPAPMLKQETQRAFDSARSVELSKLASVLQQAQSTRQPITKQIVTPTPPVLHTSRIVRPERPVLPGKNASIDEIRAFYRENPSTVLVRNPNTYLVKPDGTVLLIGEHTSNLYRPNGRDWSDIVSLSGSLGRIMGVRTDGSVLTDIKLKNASNIKRFSEVQNWHDIVTIDQSIDHCYGLRADGSVVTTNPNMPMHDWHDIVSIVCGLDHVIGLRANGTVAAIGGNEHGQCNVDSWRDIVSIDTGGSNTFGLCANGRVVAVGANTYGQCEVQDWRYITSILCYGTRTYGLQSGGTVVGTGKDPGNVENWRDICSIHCDNHFVGRRMDGTAVAIGDNRYGQCNIQNWKNVIAIFPGPKRTLGILDDGSVICTDYQERKVSHFFRADETIITPLPTKTLPFKLF